MANFRGFVFVCMSCLILAAAVILVEADKCGDDIQGLVNNCSPILSGNPPSAVCCCLIRSADLGCVCPKVTPQIAALVNVPKLVSLVESCGRNVPHHTQCGSIYFTLQLNSFIYDHCIALFYFIQSLMLQLFICFSIQLFCRHCNALIFECNSQPLDKKSYCRFGVHLLHII